MLTSLPSSPITTPRPRLMRSQSAPIPLCLGENFKKATIEFAQEAEKIKREFLPLSQAKMQALAKEIQVIDKNMPIDEALEEKRALVKKHFGSPKLIEALSNYYKQYTLFVRDKEGDPIGLKRPSPDDKKIHIVGGPPGSGKSTTVRRLEHQHKDRAVMVDPDFLVKMHPQFEQIQELFGHQWGEVTTVINRPVRKTIIEKLCKENYQICVEGSKSFANYIPKALSSDYKVKLHLPVLPFLLSQQRSMQRMVDQKKDGRAIRGMTPEEYEDENIGHHTLAHKAVEEFFNRYSDDVLPRPNGTPPIEVILHRTTINGEEDTCLITSFKDFEDIMNDINNDAKTAGDHFEHLRLQKPKSAGLHLERSAAIYAQLKQVGCNMENASPYLPTMGIDVKNPEQHLDYPLDSKDVTFFAKPFPVIGGHKSRTKKDIDHTLDIYVGDTVTSEQYNALLKKYNILIG